MLLLTFQSFSITNFGIGVNFDYGLLGVRVAINIYFVAFNASLDARISKWN